NSLTIGAGHDYFVIDVVVSNVMRRAADLRCLSCNTSRRCYIAVRQPGERRNLREGHSVKGQKLVSFGVVCSRPDVAEHRSGSIGRCRPDHSDGCRVARGRPAVDRGRMISKISDDKFVVLRVHENTLRITQVRVWAFQDANGSDVATRSSAEDQDFMRDWI